MDETIPQVDGLRLMARADDAGRGELWRARSTGGLAGKEGIRLPADLPGVGECRVRLLRMPVDEVMRARAQTLARDLLTLDDPGLIPIRSVRKAYDGVALVYGHVPAPSTGLHLLARRRMLLAGEVVTLGIALSWALAHAHAAGIAHGRLCDADVLIAADGHPVLTGVGVLGVLGAPGEAEGDVRALERMLASLLDRESPGAARVAGALAAGSTTATGLAAVLAAAAPAVPIRVDERASGGEREDRPDAGSRRMLARVRLPGRVRPRVMGAGAGVVLLAALVGWMSASGSHAKARAAAPGKPALVPRAAVDWRQVLTQLDLARSAAFARPAAADFAGIDVPGNAAYRYDTAAAASLRARRVHAFGLRIAIEQVTVESVTGHRVILRVIDQRLPYEVRDGRGTVVSRVAARGKVVHRIELEATVPANPVGPAAWRFARITDLSPTVSS